MKIAKVWNNRYAWDTRIEKISASLSSEGHDIHLVCNDGVNEIEAKRISRLSIHRLPGTTLRKLRGIISAPLFFNPFWFITLWRVVRREGIELILVRDLPLVPVGIMVGAICRIPVIFDMAENYPAMWRELTDRRGVRRLTNFVLRNPWVASVVESWCVRHADHTFVVVEESLERLLANGADGSRISIVGNTPPLTDAASVRDSGDASHDSDADQKFTLMYTGFVDNCRGLETAIRAMPELRATVSNIELVVAGGGEEPLLNKLRDLGNELGLADCLEFTGWLPHNEMPAYIRSGDVCIVPHDSTEMVNSTIPNKLFDYMYARKSVLVSDAKPLKRIVEQFNCGEVFHAQDPKSFASAVLRLRDAAVRRKHGENGRAAIVSACNWEIDSALLNEVIRHFSSDGEGAAIAG